MKRAFAILSTLILLTSAASAQTLSVMSYNVRHLAGMDDVVDPARTASVILTQRPDIVMLQEIDSCNARTLQQNQAELLGQATGLHATFARAIPFEGGAYGVALLSRDEPVNVRRIPLPGSEPRVLLIAEFRDYVAACTHLALEEADRLTSVEIIVREAAKYPGKPFIIAGDWNDTPDSELLQRLRKRFTINSPQCPTYPAPRPEDCIDYIATLSTFPAQSYDASVVNAPGASDHRPIVVTLSF